MNALNQTNVFFSLPYRITNDSSSFSDQVKDKLRIRTKSTGEKFMDFAKKNVYLAGGFTGGFFIGLASS